jgi:hypothetical protein
MLANKTANMEMVGYPVRAQRNHECVDIKIKLCTNMFNITHIEEL